MNKKVEHRHGYALQKDLMFFDSNNTYDYTKKCKPYFHILY